MTRSSPEVDTIVFDVLGTLVDLDGAVRAAVRALVPDADDDRVDDLAARWEEHVGAEHRRVIAGERAYATADVLDREAGRLVAERAGATDRTAADEVESPTRQVAAWPDSAAALDRLAARYEVVGLSNADLTTLLRLDARAGLRWHLSLSAELAQSFKPDPRVYRMALDRIGRPAERTLLVATHAWDLRAARAEGMRTAYLARPTGDPPTPDDAFDHHVTSVDELLAVLLDRPSTGDPA
ncbi:haloacid dehalogenase type II [Actinomycetospora atypica]|uniref:Haloacid dehalogenase type II n=1 Tax=Actinomycetospora atypica TaxID=1290095 RepID=A0ABV9YPA6_9PSEU